MKIDRPLKELYREYGIVKPGDTVLQVGCNMAGSFVFALAELVGEKGKVVVIEPNPIDIFKVREKFKHIGCSFIAVQKAVWDKKGAAKLYVGRPDADTARLGMIDLVKIKENDCGRITSKIETVEVETDTIDNILDDIGVSRVSHIELTINGAEWNALKGMKKTLLMQDVSFRIATGRQCGPIQTRIGAKKDYEAIQERLWTNGFRTEFARIQLPLRAKLNYIISHIRQRRMPTAPYGFLVAANGKKDLSFISQTNWGYSQPREKKKTRLEKICGQDVFDVYHYASNLEKEKKYDMALKYFMDVYERNNISPEIRGGICYHIGRIHYELKNNSHAQEYLNKVLEFVPDHKESKRVLEAIGK